MYHPDDPYSPAERAKRRRLFSSRPSDEPGSDETTPEGVEHLEQMMASYQATIQQQLEEGLSSIRHTANKLMHEVASEVWRTAGGDKDEVRSRIVHHLARDQAIRSLIAHSDERFQALAVRTARLEDTLNLVADSVRDAKAQLADNIGQYGMPIASGDTAALRAQLADITRQIAGALQALAERDQEVVEAVRSRILEHGQLITSETTRISRAMESYVQHGVEAIGQLAGSMEAQVHALATRDDVIADRIREIVEQQTALLGEQLQLMYDRMAIDTAAITDATNRHTERDIERSRALAEQVQLMYERMAIDTRSITDAVSELNTAVSGTIEARLDDSIEAMDAKLAEKITGLARLVRSDNVTLAEQIAAGQTATKQTLRALKELQANLPADVIDLVEQRLASLAETIERSNETLAKRIDNMADTIGRRQDGDIQVVIDRMGDAMHALASLGRAEHEEPQRSQSRIELE